MENSTGLSCSMSAEEREELQKFIEDNL
jgi:hypothetical protein